MRRSVSLLIPLYLGATLIGASRTPRSIVPVAAAADMTTVARPSREEKVKMLREVGIIDAKGELAKKYRSWGSRVSRTDAGA